MFLCSPSLLQSRRCGTPSGGVRFKALRRQAGEKGSLRWPFVREQVFKVSASISLAGNAASIKEDRAC